MKKIFTILASAVVALSMSACVKDITTDVTEGNGVYRTIGANIESMTRTSMDDFEPGETAQVVWSEGDVIGVITADGTIRKATLMAEYAGKVEGEFEVENAVEGETYQYGFYPYGEIVTYSGGTLSNFRLVPNRKFVLGESNEKPELASGKTFPANELPMVGKLTEKGTLNFKSICGIVEVKLLADINESIDKDTNETVFSKQTIFNVTLQSDANILSGIGSVDLTAETPQFSYPTKYEYGDTGATADLYTSHVAYMLGAQNHNTGFVLDPEVPTSLFFVLPIGTYNDLLLHTATPGIAVTKHSSKSHEVKAHTILSLSPINIDRISDLYKGSDVTDLSVNPTTGEPEYAYCYLVKPSDTPKRYKFKAVLPDGTKVLKTPNGTNVGNLNGNYNTTYVFAEDTDGVIQDLRREGDWVYFSASKPGNALIVIGGTNLVPVTSYHIWVSDVQDQALAGGHVFMDRNLGATYAPQTYAEAQKMTTEQIWRSSGCFYQWGSTLPRPAFPSKSVSTVDTKPSGLASSWKDNNWIQHKWAGSYYYTNWFGSNSSANALVRTRTYYNQWQCAYENVSSNDTTITQKDDFGVWYRSNLATFGDTPLNVGENALWQSKKTMFDPCPPGYRVPSKQELEDAFTNEGAHTGKQFKISRPSAGFYFSHDDKFVFISICGYRKGNDGAMFNTYFSNYPRTGWWYFDESLTAEAIADAATNKLTVRYATSGGGADLNTTTAQGVGGRSTHPYLSMEQANATWTDTGIPYTDNQAATAPTMKKYRTGLCNGLGLRCVRAANTSMTEGQAPSFEVEDPTEF